MAISFSCSCGREYNVGDSAAGKKTKCKDCGEVITVPSPPPKAPTPKKSREPAVARKKKKKPAAEFAEVVDDYEDDYADSFDDHDDDYGDDGYDDDDYDEQPRRRSSSRSKSRSKSAGSSSTRTRGSKKKKKKSKKGSGGGGRMALIIGGAIIGVAAIGGFGFLIFSLIGGDSHDAIIDDTIALMEDMLDIVNNVKDADGARAAVSKLEALQPRAQKLADRMKAIGNPTKAKQKELMERMKKKGDEFKARRRTNPPPADAMLILVPAIQKVVLPLTNLQNGRFG